ncbi:MAG: Gfo/Idh/MocA family oxidoreductase [Victivallales bacterium]|nr:Gfo/Idh/MocA family oxidoreductase [Victivallales bacterium]
MARFRVAQIGILHEHASGIMATAAHFSKDFEVVALAAEPDASPERLASFHQKYCPPECKVMSQDELLALPDLDAVFIETDMRQLVATAMKAARTNHHIHIDKPMGSEELEPMIELVRECEKRKLVLHPGYMFRGHATFEFMKAAVRKGWIGEVMQIDANMNRNDRDQHFRDWLATYPGGGMFDFGSHIIDVVTDLFGAPDRVLPILKKTRDGLMDNALAVMEYPHLIATMSCGLNINPVRRRFTIRGSEGFLEVNPIEPAHSGYPLFDQKKPAVVTMVLSKDNDTFRAGTYDIPFALEDRYIDMLRDFVKIVRGEIPNPHNGDYEIMVQKVILACSGYLPWSK